MAISPRRQMRRRNPFLIITFLLSVSGSCSSTAEGSDPDSQTLSPIYDLSLEELLKVKVYTPSIIPLSIEESPGVVRVFTKEDIERGGFVTLADLMRQVPGVQVVDSGRGTQTVWVRGIQDEDNSKIMIFILNFRSRSYAKARVTKYSFYSIFST